MKTIIKLRTILSSVICILLASTINAQDVVDAQDVVIGSDKNLLANFDEFTTFQWASHARGDNSIFLLEDAVLKSRVRDAVKYELGARGYKYSTQNPDLIVNFRVFEGPVTYHGFIDSFQDENYWFGNEIKFDAIGIKPKAEVRNLNEDQRKYFLDKGALVVQIVNTDNNELIWSGYVSGLMDGDVFDTDEEQIRKAIQTLFEREFYWTSEG